MSRAAKQEGQKLAEYRAQQEAEESDGIAREWDQLSALLEADPQGFVQELARLERNAAAVPPSNATQVHVIGVLTALCLSVAAVAATLAAVSAFEGITDWVVGGAVFFGLCAAVLLIWFGTAATNGDERLWAHQAVVAVEADRLHVARQLNLERLADRGVAPSPASAPAEALPAPPDPSGTVPPRARWRRAVDVLRGR